MEESILTSTKKMLNVGEDDTSFDLDIITHINTAFSHLQQLGIGPEAGFAIEDAEAKWEDFVVASLPVASSIKTNIFFRVRGAFDPPEMPHVLNALQASLLESDVRLSIMREDEDWFLPEVDIPVIIDGGNAEG